MTPGSDAPVITKETETFGFLLCPGHPMLPVSAAIDVLALTNYVSGKPLYAWNSLSVETGPVESMNGWRLMADYALKSAPRMSSVVVCCGVNGHTQATPPILAWLREQATRGVRIGAMSTGAWVLAKAGLLKNRRCTVHWEDLTAFREVYPDYETTSELFESDGPIFTCSGGTAVVDLFLTFVATKHGIALANEVAEQILHGTIRTPIEAPLANQTLHLGVTNQAVRQAIGLMEKNLEAPIPVKEIAAAIDLSVRQMERLFRVHMGRTPQLYYRECRLMRAQSLLLRTGLSVSEIALACGFSSSSYLAKCYLHQFGRLPKDERSVPPLTRFQTSSENL